MRLAVLLLYFALALIAVLCIREPHGEARHPLLVRTAMPTDNTARSNELFVPCPLSPQNIPIPEERSA
jgi:hypothetical protein